MKTFLQHIADDIHNGKYGEDYSRIMIVFPNKRARLFMNEYLYDLHGSALWSPAYSTITELFARYSDQIEADPLLQVSELHKSYMACTGRQETLDQFFSWGQLLLSDFNDIDKHLVDARSLFTNLRDLHELDTVSYLTDDQRSALKEFFSTFTDEHENVIQRQFIEVWSHLYEIYEDVNRRLSERGMAYEGALQRRVCERGDLDFPFDHYLLVGFNVLTGTERCLFDMLRRSGKAHFYWDYDHYYMPKKIGGLWDPDQRCAGQHIARNMGTMPNEWAEDHPTYNHFKQPKKITIVSSSTADTQARYIPQWMSQHDIDTSNRDAAIVLCDVQLLPTVIHCLPPTPDGSGGVNITTGYPLSMTPVSTFIDLLIAMNTEGYNRQKREYSLRAVTRVLRHPYTEYVSEEALILLDTLQQTRTYHPRLEQLQSVSGEEPSDSLSQLFPDTEQWGGTGREVTLHLIEYLLRILRTAGRRLYEKLMIEEIATGGKNDAMRESADPLRSESIYQAYKILNRIYGLMQSGDLDIDLLTFRRVYQQLLDSTNIPYHGEPVQGMQVMAPMETRNLDFRHVLILSCNEGNMPRHSGSTSFIPHLLRQAYGLTTIDRQSDIYAYYFYHILQRADDVTIVYSKVSENGQSGEMSRYLLQLLVDYPFEIQRKSLVSQDHIEISEPQSVNKDDRAIQIMTSQRFSPSALGKYMRCPLLFYYKYIVGVDEPREEDGDTVDALLFGSVIHDAMEHLYKPFLYASMQQPVSRDMLEKLSKDKARIREAVDQAFLGNIYREQKAKSALPVRRPKKMQYNGLQSISRDVIEQYVKRQIEYDSKSAPLYLLEMETDIETRLSVIIPSTGQQHTVTLHGRLDRLDRVGTGQSEMLRVVDYKTGRKEPKGIGEVAEIFDFNNVTSKHTDYFLQTMLYALIVSEDKKYNPGQLPVGTLLMYVQNTGRNDYDPTLKCGGEPIANIECYRKEFLDGLRTMLGEMLDPSVPFEPTEDRKRCENCKMRWMCHL